MYKNVYRNDKSGKFYAFLETSKRDFRILPVFLPHENIWISAEAKVDKNGKPYRTLNLELFTTKNGYDCFRYYNPKQQAKEAEEPKTTKQGPEPHFDNGGMKAPEPLNINDPLVDELYNNDEFLDE